MLNRAKNIQLIQEKLIFNKLFLYKIDVKDYKYLDYFTKNYNGLTTKGCISEKEKDYSVFVDTQNNILKFKYSKIGSKLITHQTCINDKNLWNVVICQKISENDSFVTYKVDAIDQHYKLTKYYEYGKNISIPINVIIQ